MPKFKYAFVSTLFLLLPMVVVAQVYPNDPYFQENKQWGLEKIKAPLAWTISTGSSDIIIAVIDLGVDLTHEDLESKYVTGYNVFRQNNDVQAPMVVMEPQLLELSLQNQVTTKA